MKHVKFGLSAVLLSAGLVLSACSDEDHSAAHSSRPAELEKIPGTEFNRITLTPKAAERLGVETEDVKETKISRRRSPGGEVVPWPEDVSQTNGAALILVRLSPQDLEQVDRSSPANVTPLGNADASGKLTAEPLQLATMSEGSDATALYYVIRAGGDKLKPTQRVRLEMPLSDREVVKRVVPYGAIVYGPKGDTWVYVSPAPLTYAREPVTVDFISGDLAVLAEGPAVGTTVVKVGAAELYGAEIGIGH